MFDRTRLLDPDRALAVMEKRAIDPRIRAALGAIAAGGAYLAATSPIQRFLMDKVTGDSPVAENESPIPIEQDERGEEVLKWINRFKEENPSTKEVPVFVSGKVPTSVYVSPLIMKSDAIKKHFESEFGVSEPGVYLRELSAPSALHEMGHAAGNKKIPGITLLTHGISALALPLLAWTIFKKPVANAGFIERYAPAIAGAMQVPLLAEEAAASIMAEKVLQKDDASGKDVLVPAWLTYLVGAGAVPTAAAAAKYLKRI